MKNSLAQFTRIVVTLLLTLSTFSAVAGQVDSCSQITGGVVGADYTLNSNEWCADTPTDIVMHFGTNNVHARTFLLSDFVSIENKGTKILIPKLKVAGSSLVARSTLPRHNR